MRAFIFLMTSFSLVSSAFALDGVLPLLKCTPPDGTLFQFVVSRLEECSPTPEGPVCNGKLALEWYGWDSARNQWADQGGVTGLDNTAVVNKADGVFTYHYSDAGGSHIAIDVLNNQSTVDINMPIGTQLIPNVNTGGVQTSYQCAFL